MRYWINDCFENHGRCHENDPTDWPTRLLDLVRFWSSGDIVLVELERILNERISYTTLCWDLVMGVGLINYLSGKSYLNALFLSCNGPCLLCSHAGGASFSTH